AAICRWRQGHDEKAAIQGQEEQGGDQLACHAQEVDCQRNLMLNEQGGLSVHHQEAVDRNAARVRMAKKERTQPSRFYASFDRLGTDGGSRSPRKRAPRWAPFSIF